MEKINKNKIILDPFLNMNFKWKGVNKIKNINGINPGCKKKLSNSSPSINLKKALCVPHPGQSCPVVSLIRHVNIKN